MAIQIVYESRSFPAGAPVANGVATLNTSWNYLLWAAVTVGRPNWLYVFRHGTASRYEAIFRWSLLRMALEQSGPAAIRLRRTPAARALDPTEKGAVNYFVGMTMCKVFAAALLQAPWALHVDVFASSLSIMLTQRSRPDLIAQINGTPDWVVLESKGRISAPDAAVKAKAKAQAKRLPPITGGTQRYQIGGITYLKSEVVQYYWEDPVGRNGRGGPDGGSLDVPDDAWRYYYEPITEVARAAGTDNVSPNTSLRIDQVDMSLTIHPRIAPLLFAKKWREAKELCERIQQDLTAAGYQPDGIKIEAGRSWLVPFGSRGAEA